MLEPWQKVTYRPLWNLNAYEETGVQARHKVTYRPLWNLNVACVHAYCTLCSVTYRPLWNLKAGEYKISATDMGLHIDHYGI